MTESPKTETQTTGGASDQPVASSLSAEAAEFVPSGTQLPNGPAKSATKLGTAIQPGQDNGIAGWKDKQRSVAELPSFLTSCYPFVQPNGSVRPPLNRFPAPYRLQGNVPFQGMPVSVPIPPSSWAQPSTPMPPAKVMVNRFSHPRQMGESFSPADPMPPADLPPNGLLPSPHPAMPLVTPQAAPPAPPPLMMNTHTHPDLLYSLMRGATDPTQTPPFFHHHHQMSKPPPAPNQMPLRPPLVPASQSTRPPPITLPGQQHQPHQRLRMPKPKPAFPPPFVSKATAPFLPAPASSALSTAANEPLLSGPKSSSSSSPSAGFQKRLSMGGSNSFAYAPAAGQKDMKVPGPQVAKPPQQVKRDRYPERPASPVLISRSAQTDLPQGLKLMSLRDKPHPLFNGRVQSKDLSKSEMETDRDPNASTRIRNDSGHKTIVQCLSISIQVSPVDKSLQLPPDASDSPNGGFLNGKSASFWKEKNKQQTGGGASRGDGTRRLASSSSPMRSPAFPPSTLSSSHKEAGIEKLTNGNNATMGRVDGSDYKDSIREASEHRKRQGRKKHAKEAGGNLSGQQMGGSRFLSRSSSSISSSGAREDDEKIDLHSWTDFPPMSARSGSLHVVPASIAPEESAPIKVQRSKDAPPWMLKHSIDVKEEGKENVSSQQGHSSISSQQKKTENGMAPLQGDVYDKRDGDQKNNRSTINAHAEQQSKSYSGKLQQNLGQPWGWGSPKPQPAQPLQPQQYENQPPPNAAVPPARNYAQATQQAVAARSQSTATTAGGHPAQVAVSQSSQLLSSPPSHSFTQKQPDKQQQHQQQQQYPQQYSRSDVNFQAQSKTAHRGGQEPQAFAHPPTKVPATAKGSHSVKTTVPSEEAVVNTPTWPTITSASKVTPAHASEKSKQHDEGKAIFDRDSAGEKEGRKKHKRDNSEDGRPGEEQVRDEEDDGTRHTRRRRRTRRRSKGKSSHDQSRSDIEGVSGDDAKGRGVSEMTLHFEDVDEFPDLLAASRGLSQDAFPVLGGERSTLSGTSLSYSDVIKSHTQSWPHSLTGSCVSGDNDEDGGSNIAESKRARKRRKRREQANKAAETELAEISLEQRLLKEGLKKTVGTTPGLISDGTVVKEAKKQAGGGGGGGKKSKDPISFSIADVLDAIQKKSMEPRSSSVPSPVSPSSSKAGQQRGSKAAVGRTSINMLDSSGPVQKRGKEREVAKPKKPSPLKKVILKEREEKKRMRLLDGGKEDVMGTSAGVGILGTESELSQDALSSKSEGTDGAEQLERAELSADLSPISQTSPIPMSPASPGNSGVNSPVTGSGRDPVVMKIHSRRFREYCTQILDKEIDQCCTALLQDLVRFQDRMYHKDPVKAKSKRRLVLGLREVTKHLRLKKIKCVVISPNLEKIQSKGGLDEALNKILTMCQDQNVPFVFALGRRALGRACAKLVPVSVVGIFNFDGCDDKYHTLVSLTANARSAYHEMVAAVEREVAQHAASMAWQEPSMSGVSSLLPAHMGHSRTPSGCSAISFTSSIMSEPHSEFYPSYADEQRLSEVAHHPNTTSGIGGSANDIDDGNEADTEDYGEAKKLRRVLRGNNSVRFDEDDKVATAVDAGMGAGPSLGSPTTSGGLSSASTAGGSNVNTNNSSSNSNSGGGSSTTTTANNGGGPMEVRPHHHHHNLHHHRRQSSVSSLARINEGVDDESAAKPDEKEAAARERNAAEGKSEKPAASPNLNPTPTPTVSHIDSIHSPHHQLADGILPTSSVGNGDGNGDVNDEDEEEEEDVEEGNDEEEDEEEEEEEEEGGKEETTAQHRRGHLRQRSMDKKERIKNWLESQTHIPHQDL